MEQQLATTNILLGVMAAVSVLEGLVLIGAGIAGFVVYRRVMAAALLLHGIEQRQIEPLAARLHTILKDVQKMTSTMREETERVDQAIKTTLARVDDTAHRVRDNVRLKTSGIVGVIRGARVALERMLGSRDEPEADSAPRL